MTHAIALSLAGDLVAAGYRVEVLLDPGRPAPDIRAADSPAVADVRLPLNVVGRRLGLADLRELEQLLDRLGLRGVLEGDFVRVLAA